MSSMSTLLLKQSVKPGHTHSSFRLFQRRALIEPLLPTLECTTAKVSWMHWPFVLLFQLEKSGQSPHLIVIHRATASIPVEHACAEVLVLLWQQQPFEFCISLLEGRKAGKRA